jgi:hypothetical protein
MSNPSLQEIREAVIMARYANQTAIQLVMELTAQRALDKGDVHAAEVFAKLAVK